MDTELLYQLPLYGGSDEAEVLLLYEAMPQGLPLGAAAGSLPLPW